MNDPWLWRGAAVLLGGVLAVQALGEFASAFWLTALGLIVVVLLAVFVWRPSYFAGRWRWSEIVLVLVSVLVGAVLGGSGYMRLAPPVVMSGVNAEGRVLSWSVDEARVGRGVVQTAEAKYVFVVYPARSGSSARGSGSGREVAPELAPSWQNLQPGSVIRFTAKLEQPQPPRSRGAFDPRIYYGTRGYAGKLTAQSDAVVLEQGRAPLVWWIRAKVRYVVDRYWPEKGPVLEAMLFGDKSHVPAEEMERYKITGVLHVFAASGLHMGFVAALAWGMLFFVPKKARIFLCLGIIFLYMGLCDFSVSVCRAGILAGGLLLGRLGSGRAGSLRWVLWSALLLFVWKPLFLADVSFWLSFSAVLGLVCLTSKLEGLKVWRRAPAFMRRAVCAPLAAQMAVTPVLAAAFYRVSLVGVLFNVLLAGVFGVVIQLGLIGVALLVVGEAPALPFFQAAVWLVGWMDKLLAAVARMPWADVWVLQPGWFFWAAWYGVLVLWLADPRRAVFVLEAWRRRALWWVRGWVKAPRDAAFERLLRPRLAAEQKPLGTKLLVVGVTGVLALSLLQISVRPEGLEVVFIDVGQGDCVLLRSREATVMIDAGPRSDSFDSAERIVVPYLLEHGVKEIDMLLISHADMDHIGGARYLLSRFPVAGVAAPALGSVLLDEAWRDGLPFAFWPDGEMVTQVAAGDCLSWGDLRVEVLAPVLSAAADAGSNNASLVLRVSYKGWSVLLTGDMEKEEMRTILERGVVGDVTFIKAPHHGSKGSMDEGFFDVLRPEAVFIPVGRNSYGHPSGEVLDYWAARGVPVYRTDEDGTIRLILGREARVEVHGR
ncbi:MAG: DNA internalization-related competence protein ComEC/Rec2 [Gracilibacteraceae bacterium]|jgi:competence protein ComEC|nr:DNA internalization-related competence protein ComEC/Rec2 [Gracilibacteraceae bacterium]